MKIKLAAVVLAMAFMSSCADPASKVPKSTDLYLGPYMNKGFCSKVYEGGDEKSVVIRVVIDTYDGQGVGFTPSWKQFTYSRGNDMTKNGNKVIDVTSLINNEIRTQIPESGSYVVRVIALGLECYDCCDNGLRCSSDQGEPWYDGAGIAINLDKPNPQQIFVNPDRKSCI